MIAVAQILGGGVVFAVGILLCVLGLIEIAQGFAVAHAGGVNLLILGVPCAVGGALASRSGKRKYKEIEANGEARTNL